MEWLGDQAVVPFPEHVDSSNVGQVSERLLSAISRGAAALIGDMTMTVSCDHAGADAVARAFQRAVVNGTQLRLRSAAVPRELSADLSQEGMPAGRDGNFCPVQGGRRAGL